VSEAHKANVLPFPDAAAECLQALENRVKKKKNKKIKKMQLTTFQQVEYALQKFHPREKLV
jgi:hypothetical protein